MITDAGLALASWLLCILVLVLSLLALAHWNARPVAVVEDPTPFEDVPLWHDGIDGGHDWDETVEILAVDPPVVPAYIPPAGMVLYRGGAVHPECAQRWLRFDLTPIDGCAVWLTDQLKEIVT